LFACSICDIVCEAVTSSCSRIDYLGSATCATVHFVKTSLGLRSAP